jgi:hypothetical protein
MDGDVWRPALLRPEQMDERRLAAARLLRQGQLSQAEIARQLGVDAPASAAWMPGSPKRVDAACNRDLSQGDHRGSMRRPGPALGGSSTGAPRQRALPPSASRSSALRPRSSASSEELSSALSGAASQGAWLQVQRPAN